LKPLGKAHREIMLAFNNTDGRLPFVSQVGNILQKFIDKDVISCTVALTAKKNIIIASP
jgi:hypothetical protein